MLLAGDEMGRTQQGNNNAYCQDNEISWVDWKLTDEDRDLADFTARVIALLKAHPVFRRRRFFQGRPIRGSTVKDVHWVTPEGRRDERRRVVARSRPLPRHVPVGQRDHRDRRGAGGRCATTTSCCW